MFLEYIRYQIWKCGNVVKLWKCDITEYFVKLPTVELYKCTNVSSEYFKLDLIVEPGKERKLLTTV